MNQPLGRPRAPAHSRSRVTVPTLLVRGGDADVFGEDGAADTHSPDPNRGGVEVIGAGHMVVGNDNNASAGQLERFLDSLS